MIKVSIWSINAIIIVVMVRSYYFLLPVIDFLLMCGNDNSSISKAAIL